MKRLRNWLIAAAVGVMLTCICLVLVVVFYKPDPETAARWTAEAVAGKTEAARPSDTPGPTSTAGQTNTPAPTDTPAPTNTPEPTPTPNWAGVTEWIFSDGLRVGVTQMEWGNDIGGLWRPDAEKIFLSIYIVAVNESTGERSFSASDFEIVDGSGQIGGLLIASKEPEFKAVCTVVPGGVCEGWWTTQLFDREGTRAGLIFRWNPGFFSVTQETAIVQPGQ